MNDDLVPELEEMIDSFHGDIDEYGKGVYGLWERLLVDDELFARLVADRSRSTTR